MTNPRIFNSGAYFRRMLIFFLFQYKAARIHMILQYSGDMRLKQDKVRLRFENNIE